MKLALDIIKEFEGFRPDAYPDPRTGDEPWTIGYGTTVYSDGTTVKQGDKVTEKQALAELSAKVASLRIELSKLITVPLTDGQMACMISFAYNMGVSGSGLQIARLNSGKIAEFKRKHMEYVNKGTAVEAGLRRRRKAELELFSMEERPAQWINLVRHGTKAEPDLRAYLMDGDTAVSLKRFTTTQDLINILAAHRNAGITIGEYGWHKEPVETGKPAKPKMLPVPYYSQRDYGGPLAWSICGCTSVAMVLSFWGIKIDPDGVLKGWGKASCQSPPGCEGVFEANKLKASSTYKGTWKQIRDQIDLGRPVVIHGMMTGSGHIMVVIGYDDKGYWCNDPAGKWQQVNGDSYSDNPKNGAGVYYREEAMWKACGGDGDVWYSVAFT